MGRFREWLDASLFRESPTAPPLTWRRAGVGLTLALAGVAIVLARVGWEAPLGSLWAEDGRDFLGPALDKGFLEALFTTYSGYLHLVPRLLAEPAILVGIDSAPEVIAVEAAAVTVLCAFVVWWASAAHLRDPLLRALLAALVVLLPVVGFEGPASIANLQWFLLLPAFWLLLWRPARFPAAVGGGLFVALTVASAPVALAFAPLAALRGLVVRDRRDLVLIGGFALGAVVQLAAIAIDQTPPYVEPAFGTELFAIYAQRVVGGAALGQHGGQALWLALGSVSLVLLAMSLAALVALAALRPGPQRALSLIALGLSILAFLMPGYQRDLAASMMWPAGDANALYSRYTIFPALLLITAVLLQLDWRPPNLSRAAYNRRRLIGLAAIGSVALSSFYVGDPLRGTPRWSAEVPKAREICADSAMTQVEVAISPIGWTVSVPCRHL